MVNISDSELEDIGSNPIFSTIIESNVSRFNILKKRKRKMINVLVKFEHYIKYVNENNSYYLDRKNKYRIWTKSKEFVLNGFNPINEEIFNGTETKYNVNKNEHNYCLTFKTKSETEYRFDIRKEPNTNIYHLMFSLNGINIDDYEKLTESDESIEVFSKLIWILKDLNLEVNEYCIGATGNKKKDSIYEYMMRFVKSWEKRNTNQYKLGWALYFKI